MATLKQRTITSMIWSVSDRLGMQVILAITSVILARLLLPAEIGTFSMLSIFNAVGQTMIDSGFGLALINKKELTEADKSSVFFFNLIISLLFALTLTISAPLIANFFDQPTLKPITRVIAIGQIIIALGLVHSNLFTKELKFNFLLRINLISVVFSSLVGIGMAYFGLGIWSLVGQLLSRYVINTALTWYYSPWRPSLKFSMTSLKSMFPFGSRILVSGLLKEIFNNIYITFIGRFFTPAELGFYSKANVIETAATKATSTSLTNVTFSALSPYQDDNKLLRQAYRKTTKLSHFLHLPLMIWLVIVAETLIPLLLGYRWTPSVPFFQLFCVIGLFYPLQVLNLNILKIKGKTKTYLHLQILKKSLTIIAILISYQWGIIGLLYGQLVLAIFSVYLYSYFSNLLITYGFFEQLKDIFPHFLTSLLMGTLLVFLKPHFIENNLLIIIFQGTTALIVYFGINLIIKSPELFELRLILDNQIKKIITYIKKRNL